MLFDVMLVATVLTALWWLNRPPSSATIPAGAGPEGVGRARPALSEVAAKLRGRVAKPLRAYYPKMTRQAGLDPETWRPSYWGLKLACAALPAFLILEVLSTIGLPELAGAWLIVPAIVGSFLPDLFLWATRRGRRQKVEAGLPYFLDLVVAFLHSGLSLTESFRRAGREGFEPSHPLAQEVELVGRELDAGKDPSTALRDLADRTGVPDLKGVAAALRMGIRLGSPVEETVRSQADALWTKRRENAMKQLQRAEIKMMLPVALIGFPMFGVLALFPVLMDLIEVAEEFFNLF